MNVIYDPADLTELTIEYEGHTPRKASQLVIGEMAGKHPKLPGRLQIQPAESSRLLTAAAKKNQQRKAEQAPAVSYRAVPKEGADNV